MYQEEKKTKEKGRREIKKGERKTPVGKENKRKKERREKVEKGEKEEKW